MSQDSLFDSTVKKPVAVAYGMGVDSTAMLVGLAQRGQRPDLILFADTGAERTETYDFKPVMQEWLRKEGFPPITTVRYQPRNFKNFPPYRTLEENCLTNGTLPGISMAHPSCSSKWKQAPQHAFIKQWEPAQRAWGLGLKVVKLIGFDDSPTDRRRTYSANPKDGDIYEYRMPLQQWHWDREECKRQIARAGLPVPPKSSCFFCLAMKPHEVEQLPAEMLRRIVRLEARAHPRLKTCEGLWRSTVKGTRGGIARPGSMTQYIRQSRLLPEEEIDRIWEGTFEAIVSFQEGYAAALSAGLAEEFLLGNHDWDYRNPVWSGLSPDDKPHKDLLHPLGGENSQQEEALCLD